MKIPAKNIYYTCTLQGGGAGRGGGGQVQPSQRPGGQGAQLPRGALQKGLLQGR